MPMAGTVRIEQVACEDTYMETIATFSATPQSIQLLSIELGVVSFLHWFPCQYPTCNISILCTPVQYMVVRCLCALHASEQHLYITSFKFFLFLSCTCGQSFLFICSACARWEACCGESIFAFL